MMFLAGFVVGCVVTSTAFFVWVVWGLVKWE
jgi:hypothetical protein